ncbi:MAG: hypothetical protein SGI94_14610 [Saprospiraceae bacterium]|nr:hypothetical protein [Saprospiraceae bacterium]
MTKRIITTVGASLFTNYRDKDRVVRKYSELSGEYRAIDTQYKNLEKLDHKKRQDTKYDSEIGYIKETIEYLWLPFACEKSCAELQTLAKIAEENPGIELEVYLLATDTVVSIVACELIKGWLDRGNIPSVRKCVFHSDANATDTTVVKGLQVEDARQFKMEGFSNLLKIMQKFATPEQTIFNISGGYKALIPYLTLYAQLEGIPLKYMYEESEELVTVGNLPFGFDFFLFTDEYLAFEMINPEKTFQNLPTKPEFIKNLSDPESFQQFKDNSLIIENEDKIQLSLLGNMLYKKYEAIQKEDGFSTSNLLGKVMEVKVFEFFQAQYPDAKTILGKNIGKSPGGHAYDMDVWVETGDMIWALEIKPQNVDVLVKESMKDAKKKETLEYKCAAGAFFHTQKLYEDKNLNLAIVMYHRIKPHPFQVEAFRQLKEKYDYIRWIWLEPNPKYKGNVNWSVTLDRLKEFNFKTSEWEVFNLQK